MTDKKNEYLWLLVFLIFAVLFLAFNAFFRVEISPRWTDGGKSEVADAKDEDSGSKWEEKLFPEGGVKLSVEWGDLGKQMIENGVIDKEKFEGLYVSRGGLDDYAKDLLYGTVEGDLRITQENSGLLLNLFWALGLGNKNSILEDGPMMDKEYGGAENFASTGGWSLAKSDAMDHYSKHKFITLTEEQQALVEKVSKNIYRPCCNNSTYFPDCNHGMAMLGFLELMAAQGASEKEMYESALVLNAYWFPGSYLTVAEYLDKIGTSWDKSDPAEILGANYSSSSGFRQVLSKVNPVQSNGGGSACGV